MPAILNFLSLLDHPFKLTLYTCPKLMNLYRNATRFWKLGNMFQKSLIRAYIRLISIEAFPRGYRLKCISVLFLKVFELLTIFIFLWP